MFENGKQVEPLNSGNLCGYHCGAGGTLAVNGIQAMFGHAKFAYWHLGTLAMMAFFSWVQVQENPEVKEWYAEAVRRTRFRLQKHSRTLTRAVRSLTALFTFRPFNRPQTEP